MGNNSSLKQLAMLPSRKDEEPFRKPGNRKRRVAGFQPVCRLRLHVVEFELELGNNHRRQHR